MSRGTRAVFYFFFGVVSLLLGSIAIFTGELVGFGGHAAGQPWVELYGWLVVIVAFVAPILFVFAALYALIFGSDS